MNIVKCTFCDAEIQTEEGRMPNFCPFCAQPFAQNGSTPAFSALQERLSAIKKPKDKYALIMRTLMEKPDDFEANEALLFHGRLHEPMRGKSLDFSIVKCYLFSAFATPEQFSQGQLSEKYEELLHGPQLVKTMSLSPNADQFFQSYLNRLALEYIDLFICGDANISRLPFGLASRSKESIAKRSIAPVVKMLRNVNGALQLPEDMRAKLRTSLISGYTSLFPRERNLLLLQLSEEESL